MKSDFLSSIRRLPAVFFLRTAVMFSLCLAVLSAFFLLSGCSIKKAGFPADTDRETRTGFYLDTVISVTIYGSPKEELFDGCMELAGRYENMLSRTKEGSDIWNVNHSGGKPVKVCEETLSLLETALSYAELSEGLVDPTIGTLSILWNIGSENQGIVPSDEAIREALSHVDYRNVLIDGNQVTLTEPESRLDLGFIAKGYIADRIREYLLSEGVANAVINLGGNVSVIGSRPDKTPFRVGVQQPFADTGDYALVLEVEDKSVVSSGNYERCFEKDGILYHHILSTEDGYPADTDMNGVTIICDRSVDGDALSTLCFVLGYERGRELIEDLENVEAVFIMKDGAVYKTFRGFRP